MAARPRAVLHGSTAPPLATRSRPSRPCKPQIHCGSVGLDAALLGALTQELAMREETAVAAAGGPAAGGGVPASQAAAVEALGLGPPPRWH
jgi:hypothetical protein